MGLLQELPDIATSLRAVVRSPLGTNIIALYTVQGLIYLLPLTERDDVVAATLAIPGLLAWLICLGSVPLIAPVSCYSPKILNIRTALRSASPLYLANVATTIYVNSDTFLLGIIATDVAVANYSVAN